MNQVIEGLKILAKYTDADKQCSICAEHDIIYAGPHMYDGNPLSEEDQARMEDLGWHFDDDNDCYVRFV